MAREVLMRAPRRPAALLLVCMSLAAVSLGCRRSAASVQQPTQDVAPTMSAGQRHVDNDSARHDLAMDESLGGHTLSRHVGRTDAELAQRLEREQIAAASTYTDRAAAEHTVGAALAANARKISSWTDRTGRRPNLVLRFVDRSGAPIGRTLFRGASASTPCDRALVVLRWDDRRDRSYVLTSYPDCQR